MGFVRNHAIIVTGTFGDWISKAHCKATELFPWVSPICPDQTNGSRSFFIPPDGSKEHWDESDHGDSRRASFKDFLDLLCRQYDEYGSSPLCWVEVRYGGDDQEAAIEADGDWIFREKHPPKVVEWLNQ